MKKYYIKIYNFEGSFIKNVDPNLVMSDIAFNSEINGGQGELEISLNMPWDDPESWTTPFNFVRVYVVDTENPRGRLLYTGFIAQRVPNINGALETVSLICFGLVSLLTLSYYKNGSSFIVNHSSEDPGAIISDIIDHFQTVYKPTVNPEWIGYDEVSGVRDGGGIHTVGSNVTYEFSDALWGDAIDTMASIAAADWFWYVDQGGDILFQQKPASATHVLTVGRDIQELDAPENTEEIVNSVVVRYDGGVTAAQEDATSISTYGKRELIEDDTDIKDSATAVLRAQKIRDESLSPRVQASILVNRLYDYESIKPGDTIKVRNYKKGSVVLSDNMLVVGVSYSPEVCRIQLEGKYQDFNKEIKSIAK